MATILVGFVQFRTDNFTKKLKEKQPIVILFIVTEKIEVQFLEIFLYDPGTKKGGIFYIPANLGTKIESIDRYDKVERLYNPDNIQPLKAKIEQILDLSIPFYIDTSIENLGNLVDLVGGVELFISNPVDLVYNGERVLLPSGSVLLDGDKIKDYIRYTEPLEEDRENVGRKQKFLGALLKKMGSPATRALLLKKQAFDYVQTCFKTNLNSRALQTFIVELERLQSDRMLYQRVLGTLKEVDGVQGPILFPHYEGNLIKQTVKQSLETIASDDPKYDEAMTVAIELLNGTQMDGLAKRTKALFESFGYDVISYHNADHENYLNTIILDRTGKSHFAERVAEVIKCDKIYLKLDPESNVDITIILGKDFDGRYCSK